MGEGLFHCRDLAVILGGRTILDRVDLEIPPGEVTALAGPSGAGKSTLVKALCGLVPLAGGRVLLDEEQLLPGGKGRIHHLVQPLFQDPGATLNPRHKVGRIIARGLPRGSARLRETRALMDQVGLEPGLARRLPAALSGGQRQRVAWARALAAGPRVLLLDEPFAALDHPLRQHLGRHIGEQTRLGVAVLLVTHSLHQVEGLARRLVVMAGGTCVEQGEVGQLLEEPRHQVTRNLVACCRAIRGGGG